MTIDWRVVVVGACAAFLAWFLRRASRNPSPQPEPSVPCPLVGEYPVHWQSRQHGPPERLGPDVKDAAAWDAWWRPRIAQRDPPYEITHLHEVVRSILPLLRARTDPSVLSVGCGISLEVRALAAAGIRCIGLDVSAVAIDFARRFDAFEAHADRFLDPGDRRDGGSAEWVVGSLLDPRARAGPFDVITCHRVLHYCWRQGVLDDAIQAIVARLADDGLLVVTSHNDHAGAMAVNEALVSHGFAWHWRTRPGDGGIVPPPPPGRRMFVSQSSSG